MTDERLVEMVISYARQLRAEGVPTDSLTAAFIGVGITAIVEQHGVEQAAAYVHLLADEIAPTARGQAN